MKDPATQEFKPVTSMPVGKVTGEQLNDQGFVYAYQLIGQYMMNSMDDEATDHWLENVAGVKRKDIRATLVATMRKWCERHL